LSLVNFCRSLLSTRRPGSCRGLAVLLPWLALVVPACSGPPVFDAFAPFPEAGPPASEGRGLEPGSGGGPSCAPPLPVFARPLFTQLLAELDGLRGRAARRARVEQFFAAVAAAGGFPVRDSSTVVFLYRSESARTVQLAGTFNGWQPAADSLRELPDTGLFFLEKPLGAVRHEYKLVVEGAWLRDPLNPQVTWDGIAGTGPGELNSVIPAPGSMDAPRLEWHELESTQLDHRRDIFVLLPPGYDAESCKRYPVLLVNDGNESITRAHFDEVAARAIAARKVRPVILAFVALASQADRVAEYSCEPGSRGPKYTAFLCDTLVPWLDARFRTIRSPDERGILGASMGGLISFAALFWRNDCLGRAGAQSGSFWFADQMMVKRVAATDPPVRLLRAYLDNGGPDDNQLSVHAMRDALRSRGYPVHHWENPEQVHTWEAWQDRFDEALSWLYPP
jgi:enterochelin esterase-like enzyme